MRLTALLGAGCLLCGTQAAAQAPRSVLTLSALAPMPGDTTASIRFNIPAQPLADALRAFCRQAAVRVQLDVSAAAGVQSQAVSGALTAPEALRQLLAGTGLAAQFADGETALVAPGRAARAARTRSRRSPWWARGAWGTPRGAPPPPPRPTRRCATRRSR